MENSEVQKMLTPGKATAGSCGRAGGHQTQRNVSREVTAQRRGLQGLSAEMLSEGSPQEASVKEGERRSQQEVQERKRQAGQGALRRADAELCAGQRLQSQAGPRGSGGKRGAVSRESPSATPRSLGSLLQGFAQGASGSLWEGPGGTDTALARSRPASAVSRLPPGPSAL